MFKFKLPVILVVPKRKQGNNFPSFFLDNRDAMDIEQKAMANPVRLLAGATVLVRATLSSNFSNSSKQGHCRQSAFPSCGNYWVIICGITLIYYLQAGYSKYARRQRTAGVTLARHPFGHVEPDWDRGRRKYISEMRR